MIAQIRHWLGAVAPRHPGRLHERSCIVYLSRPLNTVRRLKSRGVAHYTFCASFREYPLLTTQVL
jgi:hydroxyacyl-ACP dehydratase HTD2-like protein with hotdog domain